VLPLADEITEYDLRRGSSEFAAWIEFLELELFCRGTPASVVLEGLGQCVSVGNDKP
jgi:hypothetical protein